MRLKTALWVQAYIRRCMGEGAFAAVVTHGDDDAGAVFIKVNRLDGRSHLLAPAPAGLGDADSERKWSARSFEREESEEAIDARLARERDFDADLWVIEVEDRAGRHFLDDALAE